MTDIVKLTSEDIQRYREELSGNAILADLPSLQNIAEAVFGSAHIARDWLAKPNPVLEHQIPNELLKTPEGEKAVYELLMRVEYGVYS